MKKRDRGSVILAIVAYVFFLVAGFPADRAWSLLKPRVKMPVELKLSGLEGTWLDGRSATVRVKDVTLQNFTWDIAPWAFLVGRLRFASTCEMAGGGKVSGRVSLGRDQVVDLHGISARLPARQINDFLTKTGVELGGIFVADFSQIGIKKGMPVGVSGTLRWQDAELAGETPLVLGELKVEFVTQNEQVAINVTDSGGPLMLELAGSLNGDGGYLFTGFVAARQSAQPELGDAVRLLGESGSDGKVPLSFNGNLAKLKL